MNYEDAIKELDEIIEKLDKGNLPLKDSTALFDRASVLAKFCQEELSKTTKKLFEIKKDFDKMVEEEIERNSVNLSEKDLKKLQAEQF